MVVPAGHRDRLGEESKYSRDLKAPGINAVNCWVAMVEAPEPEIDSNALLAWAHTNRYPKVTEATIARWRRDGLLPEGRLQRLGRGNGTRRLFLSSTKEHLLALCELRYDQRIRSMDRIAWELWCEGLPVQTNRIRQVLGPIALEFDETLELLKSMSASEIQDKLVKDSGEHPRAIARMRRHVGDEALGEMIAHMGSLLAGTEVEPDPKMQEVFKKATGSGRSYTERFRDKPMLRGDLEPLQGLASMFATPSVALLAEASNEDLEKFADTFVPFVDGLKSFGTFLKKWIGPGVFGLTDVADMLRSMTWEQEAAGFLLWLRIRRVAPQADELVGALTGWLEVAEPGSRAYGLRELPELKGLLTPRRLSAALKHPKAQSRLTLELRRTSDESKEEARKLVDELDDPK